MKANAMRFPVIYGETDTLEKISAHLKQSGLRLSSRYTGYPSAVPISRKGTDSMTALSESDYLIQKRREAIAEMGANWVNHPDYKANPRHSNNPEIYIPARREYLAYIKALARIDREKNPMFQMVQAISRATTEGVPA